MKTLTYPWNCNPYINLLQACKFSLRAVSNILEAEKTKAMMKQHLIDDATLHFQEFITDLAKLLVRYNYAVPLFKWRISG